MIEGRRAPGTQAQLGDGEQEEADADELQQQRDGLLDFLAPRDDGGLLSGHPEPQGRHSLLAAGAVEQVKSDHQRGD